MQSNKKCLQNQVFVSAVSKLYLNEKCITSYKSSIVQTWCVYDEQKTNVYFNRVATENIYDVEKVVPPGG